MDEQERESPLLSESTTCLYFLQHVTKTQNPNTKHWYDIKSCVRRRGKKTEAEKKKKARYATDPSNDKVWCLVKPIAKVDKSMVDELWWTEDEMYMRNKSDNDMASYVEHHYLDVLQDAFESTGEGKLNPSNDKVWCLVKPIAKVDKSMVDELWWTEDEMYMRNKSDNDMASYVEHHYLDVLQDAFESTGEGKVDPGTKKSTDVDLDFDEMKKLSSARGLEALVSPEIQKNVKKHRRAVIGAQRILRDHDRDLSDDYSIRLIAQASLKYSQPSRLVSKKMAQFDNEAGKHRRAVIGAQRILRDHDRDLSDDYSIRLIAQASLKYSQPSRLVSKKMAQFDNEAGKYGFKSMPPSAGSKKKSTAVLSTVVSPQIEQ
eukprot:CAMPEP_0172476098 /NCGR_PEP_ID=MMETSP1065-20121228/70208_1 /TAXON_ID=265537 /ORGANISM="Amphiprora paludosa, Strain CCMP125" /LENGTH=373 /DNA_ID=CAMNT_0013234315 /DNA_START=129 /DNA_END=1251 /DNA_ORIENTATION=-